MRKNSNTEQKYFNYLIDLKKQIDTGNNFSVTNFATKRKISTAIVNYLEELGVVERKNFSYRKGYVYNWVGAAPSIDLVKQIRALHSDRAKKYNKIRQIKRELNRASDALKKKPVVAKQTTIEENPVKDVKNIEVKGATEIKVVNPRVIYTKVFFGLFTLKSTIQY